MKGGSVQKLQRELQTPVLKVKTGGSVFPLIRELQRGGRGRATETKTTVPVNQAVSMTATSFDREDDAAQRETCNKQPVILSFRLGRAAASPSALGATG